ncbi:MAG: mandelate racemase/muconate lactonizing enzyme family protein [Geminicoccaceae bacterium]
MTNTASVREVRLDALRITPATIWIFLRLIDENGLLATGEATLPKDEARVAQAAARLLPNLIGADASPSGIAQGLPGNDLGEAALRSAADLAAFDLEGQRAGKALSELLGESRRTNIPVYANINRRSVARTPEAFAESARLALETGHQTFKLAPFDEVTLEACAAGDLLRLIEPGLERIRAVRETIGAGHQLRIDCHWRFDPAAAETMIDACTPFAPDLIECPIAERVETIGAITRLRTQANRSDIRLAGLEMGVGVESFEPFLEAGAYDVIMPDVKYVGGLDIFVRLAERVEAHGALVSPHNPTGPVCHAASLHIAAVLPAFDSLEMQFDETPLFAQLAGSLKLALGDGCLTPTWHRAGLGVRLDQELIAAHRLDQLSQHYGEIAPEEKA